MIRVVALITETYAGEDGPRRLRARLDEARAGGAGLAVLPELPLDPWAPASRSPRDRDAEPPGGPRQRAQAAAAEEAGIALVGGAIVRDPATGRRHNTALVFDERGGLVGTYRKLHLPEEEGFWEASHYEPGDDLPEPLAVARWRLGIQICSDVNRPALLTALAARGIELLAAPRATPPESYDRWKLVLRVQALLGTTFLVSANRPAGEEGARIGGPSVALAPDGEVLCESEEPLALVALDEERLREARSAYPGYLAVRSRLYADAWSRAADDEA